MGHIGVKGLQHAVEGIDFDNSCIPSCTICARANIKRTPFPQLSSHRATSGVRVRFGPVQGHFFPNTKPDFQSGSPPSPERQTGPSVQAHKLLNAEPDLNRTSYYAFFFLTRFSSSGVLITLSDSMIHARNNNTVIYQCANQQ